ncbi:hypothetical protein AJ80_00515 [Polytolypa hystricis UAMH7299]|uniref:Dienelactone hydrolase domain-containing protein n=1 Tax=Polytolypa hystricis (strain UAMH7299) TaxID=1447883 RepID=A0A2B7Z3M5_POLH7|nr:hypothetical protein AJ80_00515 [Polytolypa hystricis UAMH7299]
MASCCLEGFQWDGTPIGQETTFADHNVYVTGSNTDAAVLIVHDILGWKFPNTRLLADSYARDANVTVYIPDFFGGESIAPDIIYDLVKRAAYDIPGFISRNSKEIREPQITSVAKALKAQYKSVGAIGFCWGGWAVFRLGNKANDNLVDAIVAAHPTHLTEEEIQNVGVPTQILAPETDSQYPPELKAFTNKVLPELGIDYDYQHFAGLDHGFATKGDRSSPVAVKGLERAQTAAAHWFKLHLHHGR